MRLTEGQEEGLCFIRLNYFTRIYSSTTCVIKNNFSFKKGKKSCKYHLTNTRKTRTYFEDQIGDKKFHFGHVSSEVQLQVGSCTPTRLAFRRRWVLAKEIIWGAGGMLKGTGMVWMTQEEAQWKEQRAQDQRERVLKDD